jgi:hypothetical protein
LFLVAGWHGRQEWCPYKNIVNEDFCVVGAIKTKTGHSTATGATLFCFSIEGNSNVETPFLASAAQTTHHLPLDELFIALSTLQTTCG